MQLRLNSRSQRRRLIPGRPSCAGLTLYQLRGVGFHHLTAFRPFHPVGDVTRRLLLGEQFRGGDLLYSRIQIGEVAIEQAVRWHPRDYGSSGGCHGRYLA